MARAATWSARASFFVFAFLLTTYRVWVYSAVGYQQEISKPVILLNRLLASLRKGTLDADLDAELRFHLDRETAENIRRGMRPEEARYAAQPSFAGVQKTKDAWRDR